MPDCVFCSIVAGDAPAEIVDSDPRTVAFMDINPATDGHVLVVPREHVENLWDATPDHLRDVATTAHRVALRITETLRPDGVNLLQATGAAAFQTVFHLHVHVVPRYADDGIVLPWTPAPGDPERIAGIAERLRRTG